MLPDAGGKLRPVRTFSSESKANGAKSALAFGIACMFSRDDTAGLRASPTMVHGIQLIVQAENLSRAEEILTIQPDSSA